MRRSPRERYGKLAHIDAMSLLERHFSNLVLLEVMIPAKTDRPAV